MVRVLSALARREALRAAARNFILALAKPDGDPGSGGVVGPAAWLEAGTLGLLGLDVAPRYGGHGGSIRDLAILLEERAGLDERAWGVWYQQIALRYLVGFGTEAQKERLIPELVAGRMVAAVAVAEPDAGSDIKSIRTTYRRLGSDLVLDGTKCFVSNACGADLIIVAARAAHDGRMSLLLAETPHLAGCRVAPHPLAAAMPKLDLGEIAFSETRLPETAILGHEEARGVSQIMRGLPYELLLLSITAAATLERIGAIAAGALERTRGRGAAPGQDARFAAASIRTQSLIGRSLASRCLDLFEADALDLATACSAKLWLSEAESAAAEACLGMIRPSDPDHHPLARIAFDIRADRVRAGTSEVMKELIAGTL